MSLKEVTRYSFLDQDQDASERFLPRGRESEAVLAEDESLPKHQQHFLRRHWKALCIHSLLTILNLVAAIVLFWPGSSRCPYGVHGPDLIPTPLKDSIAWEARVLDTDGLATVNPDDVDTVALGPPSPESDAAWEEIIQYQNIRISADEIGTDDRDNPGLVQLSDGSGYYASVAVFHSIHCIKYIHRLLHFDHFYRNRTESDKLELKDHGAHCLGYLLKAVKCNADLTVFPMQWSYEQAIPFGLDQSRHQCVSWDGIVSWMRERSINPFQPGLIVHPTLGWAYADGVENATGVGVGHLIGGH